MFSNCRHKSRKARAFSLIELSIVILVVAILIAGVVTGSKMFTKSQLAIAQNLTTNSPVHGIANLVLWYETTLKSSFKDTEATNGSLISAWYDNNTQVPIKNNATQSTTSAKPTYIEGAFPNGIPGVRFDGAHSTLPFNGSVIVGGSYTVFVVEQKRASLTQQYMLSGIGNTVDGVLFFGYYSFDSTIAFSHYNGSTLQYYSDSTNLSYLAPKPRIHTGILDIAVGRSCWLNGVSKCNTSGSSKNPLVSWNGANIGFRLSGYNGDIAEIIMFNRALSTDERKAIEDYLGKKYSVAIS